MNPLNEKSKRSPTWHFFSIMVFTGITDVLVLLGQEVPQLLPARMILSLLLLTLLPGYCLIAALFSEKQLKPTESLCLIPTVSLLILALNGLLVNFLLGSLDIPIITALVSSEVLVLSTIGAYKS